MIPLGGQALSSVDIVVPCYNYGRYLRCCVRSVLNQTGADIRVLVIDDASSDNTAEVALALAKEDSRVTFIRHAANCGNIKTYNEGIAWASADYFLLLSADDWLLPGALARAVTVFNEHPEVVLVHGQAVMARAGQPLPQMPAGSTRPVCRIVSGQAFIETACANSATNPVWTPTAFVRTSDQKAVGGYDPALPHAGDLHLWLTLACRGSIARLENPQAVYRTHDANMHYSFSKLKNLEQHLLAFDSLFQACGDKIAGHQDLSRQYKKQLALSAIRLAQKDLIDGQSESCGEYIAFAFELDPYVTSSRAWWQLRLLQAGGDKLAYCAKSLVRSVKNLRRSRYSDCALSSVSD